MPSPLDTALAELIEAALDRRLGGPPAAAPVRQTAAPAPGPTAGLGPWGFAGHADQAYGPLTYAQFGEDLILLNLFHQLGIARPSYLDIGAHHPLHCSNTALLYARGARGVCVEANPNLIAAFAELRPEDAILNLGVGPRAGTLDFFMIDDWSGRNTFDRATAEAFVAAHPAFAIRQVRPIPVVTLDEVVQRHCGGAWPDLLSLDTEGLDQAILDASALREGAGPSLICVEAVSGDDQDQGPQIGRLLAARGYHPAMRTAGNSIWSHRPLNAG